MVFKLGKKIAVTIALSALAVGGFASSASASEEEPPPAVLEQIQSEAGLSDGAALEALEASPFVAPYCTTRMTLTPSGGGIYRIPDAGGTAGYNCYLESGNVSIAVSTLQNALNVCYGKGLVVDGDFGPATYNALLQVQSSLGIGVDGIYGPTTRHYMKWASTGGSCRVGSTMGL